MKIGALKLMGRTNRPASVLLAAWHSKASLTWRWFLLAGLEPARFWRPRFKPYRTNNGLQWILLLPPSISVHWRQQPTMLWSRVRRHAQHRVEKENEALRQEIAGFEELARRSPHEPLH